MKFSCSNLKSGGLLDQDEGSLCITKDLETTAAENEGEVLMRRAFARTLSQRSSLLLKHRLQPTPSPLWGLALCPLLGACSMYPGE